MRCSWDVAVPDAVVEAFEAESPEHQGRGDPAGVNDYLTASRPSLTSDSGPDIFQVAPGAPWWGTAVSSTQPTTTRSPRRPTEATEISQLANGSLDALALDGSTISTLPNYLSGAGLIYYSADILAELGLEAPTNLGEWADSSVTIRAATQPPGPAHGAKDARVA